MIAIIGGMGLHADNLSRFSHLSRPVRIEFPIVPSVGLQVLTPHRDVVNKTR